ncbi:MAG: hypothetical protein AAFX06_07735 [Planctomycetota bacterium]
MFVAVAGAFLGVATYLLSLGLVPSTVTTPGEHDLRLANYLGFVYPVVVGLWVAWYRRSNRWAILGVSIGLAVGVFYYVLCNARNFFVIMLVLPCLLGGLMSVLLGRGADSSHNGASQRLLKGLLAGLVLGVVYTVLLNVFGFFVGFFARMNMASYIDMMWRAGPAAMGFASMAYLPLFQWSIGLGRRRSVTH